MERELFRVSEVAARRCRGAEQRPPLPCLQPRMTSGAGSPIGSQFDVQVFCQALRRVNVGYNIFCTFNAGACIQYAGHFFQPMSLADQSAVWRHYIVAKGRKLGFGQFADDVENNWTEGQIVAFVNTHLLGAP